MFNRLVLVSLLSLLFLPSCKLVEGCPVGPLTFNVRDPDVPCSAEAREVEVRTCEWAGYLTGEGECQFAPTMYVDLRTGECLLQGSSCFGPDLEPPDDPNVRPCQEGVGLGCCDWEPWAEFCPE